MPRLYDELMAARGGIIDRAMSGAISTFCRMLAGAQCFDMSEEVSNICTEVCHSKPSSILSALDLTRAPYPLTWIEWSPAQRRANRNNGKPVPRKVGCLLATNKSGSKGYFSLAWVHDDHDITLDPIGLVFDWDRESKEPVILKWARSYGMGDQEIYERTAAKLTAIKRLPLPDRWAKHGRSPAEVEAILDLEMRANLMPLEFCIPFLAEAQMFPGTPQFESYCNDLEGELPFVESFLLLLNSRNTIVEQTKEDFTRLNKARLRKRKQPLKEFITTRVRLSRVQSNKLNGQHLDREAARTHLCRGHFKVRRSGVYWWGPHLRGKGEPVQREYRVT